MIYPKYVYFIHSPVDLVSRAVGFVFDLFLVRFPLQWYTLVSPVDLVSTPLVSCLYKTYARSFIMIYPKCVYFIHSPVDRVSRALVCF